MRSRVKLVLFVLFLWTLLSGCGRTHDLLPTVPANNCTGTILSGTLKDSVNSQPVSRGMAILESGSLLSALPVYYFFPVQEVNTNSQGVFSLCANSISNPSVLVLEALDSTGNAYPPYVTPVTASDADLGAISMGGCALTCGFMGEQQTAAPATISGLITSAPSAETGMLLPQFALRSLDGSKTADGIQYLWALAPPLFTQNSSNSFSTAAGQCSGLAPYCSTFSVSVPAQSPIFPVAGGTLQTAVTPVYLLHAEPSNVAACAPQFASTPFQSDGQSILRAAPGAQLVAQSLNLTNCH